MSKAQVDQDEKDYKKFKLLPEEWRVTMMGPVSEEEVRGAIFTAAVNNVVLANAKEADDDLKSLREAVATAQAQYVEGTKQNNLKIQFLIKVLRGRGVSDIPDIADFSKADPDEE